MRLSTAALALAAFVGAALPGAGAAPDLAAEVSTPPDFRPIVIPDEPLRVPAPRGVRVLAGPVHGVGDALVARLRVPRGLAVRVACAGTGQCVVVSGRGHHGANCLLSNPDFVYEPLGRPGDVDVNIYATGGILWAVLVTTATPRRPAARASIDVA